MTASQLPKPSCNTQLSRSEHLFDTMTNEVPGTSGQWIQKEATFVVPNTVKNVHKNVSVQTGEEFSMEFLQDRSAVRRVPVVTDMVENRENGVGLNYNQNNRLGYQDLTDLLGLRRMDSECASDTSDFISAKGSCKDIESEACLDKLGRCNREEVDSGQGSRKAFGELNVDRAGFGPTASPIYMSESHHSNTVNGSGALDGSQSGKMKFLCSFGGKILPRPSDGKLRYVGGETRIISFRKSISWEELVKKTSSFCNQPHTIKYQLPSEDLDALISVSSDEDLQNMIEEYHGLERHEGSQRPRIFLIPLGESENTSSFEADSIQQSNPDYQYVAAVNGMIDPSPRKNIGGKNSTTEASQQGTNTVLFPMEIMSDFKALHPNQILSEPQDMTRSAIQSSFSPILHQRGDSKGVHLQSHGLNSCQGSNESSSSFMSTQPPQDNSSNSTEGYKIHPQGAVTLMDYHHPCKQADDGQLGLYHGGHSLNHNPSKDPMSTLVVGQNVGDFDGFSHGMPVQKERIFPPEPVSHQEDSKNMLSGSNDYVDCHPGMHHAYSDSKLQENGGRSVYCSQEGMSPPSPLIFAKAQSSLLLNSVISQEKPTLLRDNIESLNPRLHNQLHGTESIGLHSRLDLPNSSPCLESLGRNEDSPKCNDFHEKCRTAKQKDSLTLEQTKKVNQKDPFLHQDETLYGTRSPPTEVDYQNRFPNIIPDPSSTFTSGVVVPATINLKPLVNKKVEDSQRLQGDKTPANLLVTSQRTANDQDCALAGMPSGEKGHDVSGARNSEVAGIFPSTEQHSRDENSLADLISGLSNGQVSHEPARPELVASQKDMRFQEPLRMNSAHVHPVTVLHDPVLEKSDHMVLHKPVQDVAFKRQVSLLDDDFVNYPDKNAEKLSSNVKDVSLAPKKPPTMRNDKKQLESVKIVEDITNGITSGVQSSSLVSPYAADEPVGDLISPTATEVESVNEESEYEDDKADEEDKTESFSDAMIAEMEASIYGLQIIKNADLEELRELGSGTYGTVYHGKWRGTDVAIKRIKKSCFAGRSSEQERLTKDFWREAQILSALHHPNVVAFYGVVPDGAGGTLATVTEYMVNGSLRHALLKKDRSLDRRRKLIIAMDAAFGMEYLHSKNIVHFDLKCDNLLVNLRDPQRPICKVGDFGLSRIKRNTLVSGGVRGTLPWMAPELLNGSSIRVSEKVDVFSFGISMWEILTGEEPYANMHCGAIIGGIVKNTLRPPIPERCDSEWKKLMEQCWAPDPDIRPSFTEITNRLRAMSNALQAKVPSNQTRQMKPNV
ncbi:hypothetical protein C1H46_018449 [Malus baccata]|uniref:Protein kinase domain-containing protein n=1 Tax=Malus baccata TaxID=106549 RepID=A0A540MBM7_MALBA|nr:hypothetical protein C1H46_018449 [Malus baccata]